MKPALVILVVAVAAAGSLLVVGVVAPQNQPEKSAPVLLTPDNGLMPEVVAFAPRPEMVVDEVVVTAPRPESLPEDVCESGAWVTDPLAN
jgi:hypothetical protein